jgi:hypothetical protein
MKTIEKIVDVITGTEEIIEREMTQEEISQYEIAQAEIAAKNAEQAKILEAKSALLEKLGITEDEAKLLLS